MQDCWTSVLCAAALLIVSFGIFALCIASARYLERAKAPDAIDLGFRFPFRASHFGLASKVQKKRTAKKATHSPKTMTF